MSFLVFHCLVKLSHLVVAIRGSRHYARVFDIAALSNVDVLQRLHDAPGGGGGGNSHDFLGYSHYTSVKQTNLQI